jgi:hypothetical protein
MCAAPAVDAMPSRGLGAVSSGAAGGKELEVKRGRVHFRQTPAPDSPTQWQPSSLSSPSPQLRGIGRAYRDCGAVCPSLTAVSGWPQQVWRIMALCLQSL